MNVWMPVVVSQTNGAHLIAQFGGESASVFSEWYNAGGNMMLVLLAASILGVVIFLERAFQLYVLMRLDAKSFVDRIVTLVTHRKLREALDVCEISSKHPLVSVAKEGLVRANRREKEIERAMEKEMLSHLPDLRKRVKFLSVLANLATLLGLLGTIFGLILAFQGVSAASAVQRQDVLSAGISQAMYTTAAGIGIAAPMLLLHHLIAKRVDNIIMEVEAGASALLVAIAGAVRGNEGLDHDGNISNVHESQ